MDPLFVIYDACILHSAFLRDFLMYLAVVGQTDRMFQARWTDRIHREWIRSVLRRRPDLSRANLRRTARLMDESVRGCRVRNYQRWEERLHLLEVLQDPDDHHVLAAARTCVADAIVTHNVRDFPLERLDSFGVLAITPDNFVGCLTLMAPETIIAAASRHRASLNRPPMAANEYLDSLRRNQLPQTANALRAALL